MFCECVISAVSSMIAPKVFLYCAQVQIYDSVIVKPKLLNKAKPGSSEVCSSRLWWSHYFVTKQVYGEVNPGSVSRILEQACLEKDQTFIDLGSGTSFAFLRFLWGRCWSSGVTSSNGGGLLLHWYWIGRHTSKVCWGMFHLFICSQCIAEDAQPMVEDYKMAWIGKGQGSWIISLKLNSIFRSRWFMGHFWALRLLQGFVKLPSCSSTT